MKKLLATVVVMILMLSLAACASDSDTAKAEKENMGTDTSEASTVEEDATGDDTTGEGTPEDDSSAATIVTNEGETVTMTASDLIEAYDSNEASFEKLYKYAEIQFTGTIKQIKVDTKVIVESGKVRTGQQKIVFEEGWCLALSDNNSKYDLADFNAGDVVNVTSSIVGAPFDTDYLKEVCDGNRVVWLAGNDWAVYNDNPTALDAFMSDFSTIETVIESANAEDGNTEATPADGT